MMLLGAALLLLAIGAATADDVKCRPGCDKCIPLTAEEIAVKKAEHDAKKAEWIAKKAAQGITIQPDEAWGKGKDKNWVPTKCLKCVNEVAYKLVDGRCLCSDGYGLPLPPLPVAGQKPERPATPPTCAKCGPGFASGPNAPPVDWSPYKAAWKAAHPNGGRNLLAADGFGRIKKLVFCVPCESGKSAEDGKSCL